MAAAVCARSAVTVWSWVDAAGRQGRRACGSPLSMGGCGRRLSGSPGSGWRRPSRSSLTGWAGLPASPNRFAALQDLHDDFQLRPASPSPVRIHKTSPNKASPRTYVEIARGGEVDRSAAPGSPLGVRGAAPLVLGHDQEEKGQAGFAGQFTQRQRYLLAPASPLGVRGAAPPVLGHDEEEKGPAGSAGAVRSAAAPRAGARHRGLAAGFVDHVDGQGGSPNPAPVPSSPAAGATAATRGGGRGHASAGGAGPGGGGGGGRDGGGGGGGHGGGAGGGDISQFNRRPLPFLKCWMCSQPSYLFLGCCTETAVCSAHRCSCADAAWHLLPLPIVPDRNMAVVLMYQHFPIPPRPWMLVKAEKLGDTILYHYVSVLQVVGVDPSGIWGMYSSTPTVFMEELERVGYKETKFSAAKRNYYP